MLTFHSKRTFDEKYNIYVNVTNILMHNKLMLKTVNIQSKSVDINKCLQIYIFP